VQGVRVALWLHDYRTTSAQLAREGLSDAEGRFRFDAVPWLAPHEWGTRSIS